MLRGNTTGGSEIWGATYSLGGRPFRDPLHSLMWKRPGCGQRGGCQPQVDHVLLGVIVREIPAGRFGAEERDTPHHDQGP